VHDFDELCQLLLCDRVKSVLHEGASSPLLRYEATLERKWANKNELADVLDTCSATYDRFDRPRVGAIGADINQRASQCNISQGQGRDQNYRSNNVMKENKSFKSSETSHVGYDRMAKKPDLADKTCFKCGRKGHLREVAGCMYLT